MLPELFSACLCGGVRLPSGVECPTGAAVGQGPQSIPLSAQPADRAARVATSGRQPSREQILPRLTRAPRHGISRIPVADLVFLIVFPISGGEAAAAWPACQGRS